MQPDRLALPPDAFSQATNARVAAPAEQLTISPERQRDSSAPVARLADDSWPLAALGGLDSVRRLSLNFRVGPEGRRVRGVPLAFIAVFKQAAVRLLNEPTPRELLTAAGTTFVEWPQAGTLYATFESWKRFAEWSITEGVIALGEFDRDLLGKFLHYVRSLDVGGALKDRHLRAVAWLHLLTQDFPPADCLPRPPWMDSGFRFVDSGRVDGAQRVVIDPDTMGPLLEWSIAMVRDFAPDAIQAMERVHTLLARVAETPSADRIPRRGIRPNSTEAAAALQFLTSYVDQHGTLPGVMRGGRPVLAVKYISAMTGLDGPRVRGVAHYRDFANVPIDATRPLLVDTPIAGRFHGQPWADGIEFNDVAFSGVSSAPKMVRLIRTACLIVLNYLSGMRPHEVLTLQTGCLESIPLTENPESPTRHLVHGALYKHQNQDGERQGTGKPTVWVTIEQGADAIRVLEQIRGESPLLFPSNERTSHAALTPPLAAAWIEEFIRFVNETITARGFPEALRIPEDPGGPIALSRFRRTLHSHIYEQPDGEIAAAIQYQHTDPILGRDGYSSVAATGHQRTLSVDAARELVETLHHVADQVREGQGISGPGADRAIAAAAAAARVSATFMSDAEARLVLGDPALQVYNNPKAFSLCVYRPETAKCESLTGPDRGNCKATCSNIARLDSHVDALERQAEFDESQAQNPLTPEPISLRLSQSAAVHRLVIEEHTAARRVIADMPLDGAPGEDSLVPADAEESAS